MGMTKLLLRLIGVFTLAMTALGVAEHEVWHKPLAPGWDLIVIMTIFAMILLLRTTWIAGFINDPPLECLDADVLREAAEIVADTTNRIKRPENWASMSTPQRLNWLADRLVND